MSTAPVRGRRLTVPERRQQIVLVALELFAVRDAASVPVEEVAARAGVSPALVHHYFGGRAGLVEAALDAAASELLARFDDLPTEPAPVRVAAGLAAYLAYVQEHPRSWAALLRAGVGEADGGPAPGAAARIARRVDDTALALCMETVAVEQHLPVLELALRGWLGFVKETCASWLVDQQLDRERLHTLLSAAFLGALQSAAAVDAASEVALARFTS